MDRQQVIATLRDYEPELKPIGVVSASVFGSVARNEAGPDSDVDVVVRL
jgi:predicted nucleotidyltransferase